MSNERKFEAGDVITVRLPKGLAIKVENVIASTFSTKSEYIRDLIRRDMASREGQRTPGKEVTA